MLERLGSRHSASVPRRDHAAAVALIAVVLGAGHDGGLPVRVTGARGAAAVVLLVARWISSLVLLAAAVLGGLFARFRRITNP